MSEYVIGLAIGLFLGIACTYVALDASWERDCQKIGAHAAGDGKTYDCKVRS